MPICLERKIKCVFTSFRACRLKKKAQHEANKVKLYGLEQEHRNDRDINLVISRLIIISNLQGKLMAAISQTKLMITGKYDVMIAAQNAAPNQDATARLERIAKTLTSNYKSQQIFISKSIPLTTNF